MRNANHSNDKIALEMEEKTEELGRKQNKINGLSARIKELQDTNSNTDLELEYMK